MGAEALTPQAEPAPRRLLLDVSQTCRQPSHTGVQRVVRSLARALGASGIELLPVKLDTLFGVWRRLTPPEDQRLAWRADSRPGHGRSAKGPWQERLLPKPLARLASRTPEAFVAPRGTPLLAPEIFLPEHGRAYDQLCAPGSAARVALFYDALPLLMPQHAPGSLLRRFPIHLDQLRQFDRVLAISEASRQDLLAYWRWLGRPHPPVELLPLGIDLPTATAEQAGPRETPTILCVGTFEPRKNQGALLEAAAVLWAEGRNFRLVLAGHAHRSEAGKAVQRRLAELRSSGRPVEWLERASDEQLAQAYAQAAFTVYPSLREGYGLPVAESLQRGCPCVCSAQGSTGEIAAGGGCLTVETPDRDSLASALRRLLTDDEFRSQLASEARSRTFPTWQDSARCILETLQAARTQPTPLS